MNVTGGSTDVTTYFVLRLAATGVEATGITITGIDLQYCRSGAAPSAKVDATALAATDTAHTDNCAIEIDATDQPGLYRVDWPDAAFAAGVKEVILSVKAATCFTEHLAVQIDPPVNVTKLLGTAWLTPGTAGTPDVNVKLISDDATAANNAEAFFDGTGYAGTNNVIPTVTTLTGHTAQTGDAFARLGAPAGASIAADIAAIEAQTDDIGAAGAGLTALASAADLATVAGYLDTEIAAIKAKTDNLPAAPAATGDIPSAATIADAVWDEAATGHTDAGKAGEQLWTDVDAILVDTGTTLDTNVSAILADTGTDGVVVAAGSKTGYSLTATTGLGNQTANITGNLSGSVGSVTGAVGSVTGDVGGNVTGSVGSVAAGGITAASIATGAIDADALAADFVDEILDEQIGDGTVTMRQALRVLIAGMAGKLSGAATTTVTIRNLADSANVVVATVDADGNRSAVTVTP